MNMIGCRRSAHQIEINFIRSEPETEEDFFSKLEEFAYDIGGKASWQGMSKVLAHVIINFE